MEINKEELEKYIEAIKAVIDNSLFSDLSKSVESIIKKVLVQKCFLCNLRLD